MRIVYENEKGIASIVIPSPEYQGTLEELASRVVPNGIAYEIVDDAEIPADRTFRDAWKHDTSSAPEKISVDMLKAKNIAHGIRRKMRDDLFKPLDIEVTIPSKAQQAEQARQAIRNADTKRQTDIDNARNEAELKVLVITPLEV